MSKYVCRPLAKHHDRKAFRCGVSVLDDYLRQRAGQDMRRRVAAAFVMVPADEPNVSSNEYGGEALKRGHGR